MSKNETQLRGGKRWMVAFAPEQVERIKKAAVKLTTERQTPITPAVFVHLAVEKLLRSAEKEKTNVDTKRGAGQD